MRQAALPATVDVCLVADFADAAALDGYPKHPRHVAVSAALAPLRSMREVLDFEVG